MIKKRYQYFEYNIMESIFTSSSVTYNNYLHKCCYNIVRYFHYISVFWKKHNAKELRKYTACLPGGEKITIGLLYVHLKSHNTVRLISQPFQVFLKVVDRGKRREVMFLS